MRPIQFLKAVPKSKTSAPDTLLAKLVYWGIRQDDPARAKRFLQLVWWRYFGEGQGIALLDDLVQAAADIGLSGQDMEIAAARADARAHQDASNADAVACGCFGVSWFLGGQESFFGQDRLAHLAAHLGDVAAVVR